MALLILMRRRHCGASALRSAGTRRGTIAGSLFPTEAELDEILVGPQSVTWQIASDVRLSFAMLYALLLQVSHPTVSAAVRDHSGFEERPWDRLLRTLDYVCLLVYGGRDAVAVGRRLRALHTGFRGVREDGRRYSALEPEAYAWVHATLLETYIAGHAHFGRQLRPAEIERFYREYRGLGRLIGVRERDLPPDWRTGNAATRRSPPAATPASGMRRPPYGRVRGDRAAPTSRR